MVVRKMLLLLFWLVLSADLAVAQSFFWSETIFDGATSDDLVIDGSVGSGTVYLYYEAGGSDIREGIDLDFSWDGGSAAFTAAETFEFDVGLVCCQSFAFRWGDFTGPASSVTPASVEGFLAINVVGGFGVSNDATGDDLFIDTGYDSTADAFLIGSFDWEFDLAIGGASNLVIDNALVVHEGQDIGATFKGLTIVGVPEPAAAVLLSVGLIGILSRRFK